MTKRRLMLIHYQTDKDAERLKTCLDMCRIPFVAFREYEFIGGGALWKFYIDRGPCSWEQVKREVNRVRAVKFRYVTDFYIKEGTLYQDCGTIYLKGA